LSGSFRWRMGILKRQCDLQKRTQIDVRSGRFGVTTELPPWGLPTNGRSKWNRESEAGAGGSWPGTSRRIDRDVAPLALE